MLYEPLLSVGSSSSSIVDLQVSQEEPMSIPIFNLLHEACLIFLSLHDLLISDHSLYRFSQNLNLLCNDVSLKVSGNQQQDSLSSPLSSQE